MTGPFRRVDETLSVSRLPCQHHKHIKSTHMLERLNEEIKRRAHAVRVLLVGHYSDDARNARLSWAVPVSAIRCPSKEEQWH